MTPADHRAKCIEVMAEAISLVCAWPDNRSVEAAISAFDALHGIACVVPIEATEEMIEAGFTCSVDLDEEPKCAVVDVFAAMAAAGDLTNAPEKK